MAYLSGSTELYEATSLGGLTQERFTSDLLIRPCRDWWRALFYRLCQRARLLKALSSSDAAITTGGFRAHQ